MILLQDIIPGLTPSSEATQKAAEEAAKHSKDWAELKSLSFNDLMSRLSEDLVRFAINVAIAILVFYAGRFIIRKIYKVVAAIFVRRNVDPSLSTFILSLINMLLYFILIITVIGILGIQTTSFLALFASAGVALGMALSGTMQNFAGGVLILLLKPYKIGDYIEAQGYAGTVREIQIFSTIITTYDNKAISIPNGGLSTGSVNNWSREEYRRVSWTVSVSYGDNVQQLRQAILKMFEGDERIVPLVSPEDDPKEFDEESTIAAEAPDNSESPENSENSESSETSAKVTAPKRSFMDWLLHRHRKAQEALEEWDKASKQGVKAIVPKQDRTPKVVLDALAASSVDLSIRVWTRTENYWSVFYEYNERFYTELPSCGAHFPFPQMDVHLKGNT